jgi:serine/threonine-protein kinase RsbT
MTQPSDLSIERIHTPVVIKIDEEYHVSEARLESRSLAEAAGFKTTAAYYIITSVSELANNIFFHAKRGGVIKLSTITRDGMLGIEVNAEDEGPGIPDLTLAMMDGFSTNGGLGGGLPGVKRLMDEFEITSMVGTGTRIVARKWNPCR